MPLINRPLFNLSQSWDDSAKAQSRANTGCASSVELGKVKSDLEKAISDESKARSSKDAALDKRIDDLPSAGNGKLTIKQGDTVKGTFTANQTGDVTVDLDAGGGSTNHDITFSAIVGGQDKSVATVDISTKMQPDYSTSVTMQVINEQGNEGNYYLMPTYVPDGIIQHASGSFSTLTLGQGLSVTGGILSTDFVKIPVASDNTTDWYAVKAAVDAGKTPILVSTYSGGIIGTYVAKQVQSDGGPEKFQFAHYHPQVAWTADIWVSADGTVKYNRFYPYQNTFDARYVAEVFGEFSCAQDGASFHDFGFLAPLNRGVNNGKWFKMVGPNGSTEVSWDDIFATSPNEFAKMARGYSYQKLHMVFDGICKASYNDENDAELGKFREARVYSQGILNSSGTYRVYSCDLPFGQRQGVVFDGIHTTVVNGTTTWESDYKEIHAEVDIDANLLGQFYINSSYSSPVVSAEIRWLAQAPSFPHRIIWQYCRGEYDFYSHV